MSEPFSFAGIAQSVHASLADAQAAIPEGHSEAFLLDATKDASGVGAEMIYVRKFGKDWIASAGGGWSSSHGAAGKVLVVFSR